MVQTFVRCGYPKTLETEEKFVLETYKNDIVSLVKKAKAYEAGVHFGILTDEDYSFCANEVARRLAYHRLKNHGFGGNERKIYTKEEPELLNRFFIVHDIRFVKTGEYCKGGWSGSYDGDEYEPAYLSGEKTHKILSIREIYDPNSHKMLFSSYDIEASNVVKIEENKETSICK